MHVPRITRRPRFLVLYVILATICSPSAASGKGERGNGTRSRAGLSATLTRIDFGDVQVGGSAEQFETLTNTGIASLTLHDQNTSGAGFTATELPLPLTLSPGQSYTFAITFAPISGGKVTGAMSVASRNQRTTLSIALSGKATSFGRLSASPDVLNFGDVTVGQNNQLTGDLMASGSSLTVLSVSSSSADFQVSGLTFPVKIANGQKIPFRVAFAPKAAGAVSGTITFISNVGNLSTVQLTTGRGLTPPRHTVTLSWDPSTSDVIGYNIYRGRQSGGPYSHINSAIDSAPFYTDTRVHPGFTYYYVTTAIDSSGAESGYSNEAVAVIPTP